MLDRNVARLGTAQYFVDIVGGASIKRQNNNHTKRLAGIMRGLGWLRSEEVMRFGKEVKRGFSKPCDGGM